MTDTPITLYELNRRIAALIAEPSTQNVWITAELSDVAVRRGHCYMELLEKDATGAQTAKARGVIWAGRVGELMSRFYAATGQRFGAGIKVMVRASATMHPLFGLSLVISDIDPSYTMGDLLRRRNEIIARLHAEGILEMNRTLPMPEIPQRIAVISAPGAAGYGDFVNQIANNSYRLKYRLQLFPAIMQGERTASTIIDALNRIAIEQDDWDCVVIIRGGGATSDLQGFEDYDLAANIAQFPLPVIIGIGHERDITLLDYVANMRVKTPTAAAEWLLGLGVSALDRLRDLSQQILATARERISGQKEQLSYYYGLLPLAPLNVTRRAADRLNRTTIALSGLSANRIAPQHNRLNVIASRLESALATAILRAGDRLNSSQRLLEALSPEAVLKRGYSITRVNGSIVGNISLLKPGDTIETRLLNGTIISETKATKPTD